MAQPTTLGGVGMAAVGSFPVGGSADPLVSGLFLFLDGVNAIERLQAGSLEMTDELGGTKHLEYLHQELTGGLHLIPGQKIILREGSTNIFLGTIDRLEEKLISGNVILFTRVEAVNLNATLERRLVTADEVYINILAGDIAKDLVTKYLAGEGITTNSVKNGATLANFSIKAFASVAKALRDLSDRTGFIWFVDSGSDLHFEAQTQVQAPFGISDFIAERLELTVPDTNIIEIFVTNDGILQTVLSPPKSPTPGPQFLLAQDGKIWELKATNDGLLQTVLTESAVSVEWFLLAAADGGVWALSVTNDGLLQTTSLGGTKIVGPIDDVKIGISRERYRNRQTVRFGADLGLSVTENDLTEQAARADIEGGSGIYHAVEDASEIAASAEATAFAKAKLRRFGAIPKTVQVSTRVRGLQAGQTIGMALSKHYALGNFLIDQIIMHDEDAQILRWDVTSLSGEHLADALEFWRKAIE